MNTWLLGELLHLANSDPPYWRTEFYEIKNKILLEYGTWKGIHLQHIVKHCYNCEGGKIYTEENVFGQPMRISGGRTCLRCGGNGVYQEFWTVLDVFEIGARQFHKPCGTRRSSKPELTTPPSQEFEGYIRHVRPPYYLGNEAAYWLALLFEPKIFWRRFGHSGQVSRKFTPLVILGTWLFNISQLRYLPENISKKFDRITRRFRRWKQSNCFHDFGDYTDGDRIWDRCAWCGIERGDAIGYWDLPF